MSAPRALARLDGAYQRLPDPTMLINLIPLMEAQASSEIENIVTTNDELFRSAHGAAQELTPALKEALRYREALRAGFEALQSRPITTHWPRTSARASRIARLASATPPGTYIGNTGTRAPGLVVQRCADGGC